MGRAVGPAIFALLTIHGGGSGCRGGVGWGGDAGREGVEGGDVAMRVSRLQDEHELSMMQTCRRT